MMTGYSEKLLTNGLWILAAMLLALGFVEPALAAKPEQDRGVIIPDAERVYSGVSTDIQATAEGAIWRIPLSTRQAWQVLKRSLVRLGVGITETDGETPQLLTDWVTWGYDADANTGHSKRPHFGSEGTAERHRFRFEFADVDPGGATKIKVTDAARQKKVDIAPDSEYSWMEWRDYTPQAGAAFTFGRRLQGDFQAAMSLESVSVSPPQTTDPATHGPRTKAAAEPAVTQQSGETTARSLPATPPPLAGIPIDTAPAPARAATPVMPVMPVVPVVPVVSATPATPATPATSGYSPATVTATGLLVGFPTDTAWDALLKALEDLKIDVETADRDQLMIVTRWVDANYEKKNQQLHFRSNDDSGWAFDWRGGGLQRHRFQLVLIGTGEGGKTLVRAYHTGFQEQIDQTPDSSQTLLVWEDRKTDPGVATELLRRLRIIADR